MKHALLLALLVLCACAFSAAASADYYDGYGYGYYSPPVNQSPTYQDEQWFSGNVMSNKAWLGFGLGGSSLNIPNNPSTFYGNIPTTNFVGDIDFGYKWTYAAVRAQFTGAGNTLTVYQQYAPWNVASVSQTISTFDFQLLGVLPIERMSDFYAGIGVGGLNVNYSLYSGNPWWGAAAFTSTTYLNIPISAGVDVALGRHFALNFDATYNWLCNNSSTTVVDQPTSYVTYTGGVKFMF